MVSSLTPDLLTFNLSTNNIDSGEEDNYTNSQGIDSTTHGNDNEKIEDSIMTMIAMDALPLSTVENEGFRQLLGVLAPGFVPK